MRIKLRHELKELLPHLAEMSSNAAKLCLVLHLNHREMGIDDDLARGCGWSLSTLKRAVRELRASHILEGVKSDTDKVYRVNSDHAVEVKSDTTKVYEVKPDPQLVPDFPSEPPDSKPLEFPGFEIPERCLFTDELSAVAREALAYIGFEPDRRHLSIGFIVLLEKFGKRRPWPRPGTLASQLITRCLHWQNKRKAEAKDPRLYGFPPGFQKWRDTLRRQEREAGRLERVKAA